MALDQKRGVIGFDVFKACEQVVLDHKNLTTSLTHIYAKDIRNALSQLFEKSNYWPEPLIQINPKFELGDDQNVRNLVKDALSIFFKVDGKPLTLYKHQEQAIALAKEGKSFVVTTGTGSGKSLCYFIPIIDDIIKSKSRPDWRPRTQALVIYPMNALINSQLEELNKYVSELPQDLPPNLRVSFKRLTGQEDDEEREDVASNPPDILLTNYVMLELLLTRRDELAKKIIENCKGFRYLVLDELHTYRGRHGADIAMLVRRLRVQLSPQNLICIGTSATMASGEGKGSDSKRIVAEVASKIFGVKIDESHVISEYLSRVTEDIKDEQDRLGAAIDQVNQNPPIHISDEELKRHPLAIWIEKNLGVNFDEKEKRWVRAKPLTLSEAAERLAQSAKRKEEECKKALKTMLLIAGVSERERTKSPSASSRSFFAFKLHQFISSPSSVYATIEAPGSRQISLDGQKYLPGSGGKLLYPIYFCRECGQEYYGVSLRRNLMDPLWSNAVLLAREIDETEVDEEDDEAEEEEKAEGFALVHPDDEEFTFSGSPEDCPESWVEESDGTIRFKKGLGIKLLRVAPNGAVINSKSLGELELNPNEEAKSAGTPKVWFLPGKFRVCLRCRFDYGGQGSLRSRLVSFGAIGRSSSITLMMFSLLRSMNEREELPPNQRKVLVFTDNRQDAALQAGHFNDFVWASLVRASLLRALEKAGQSGIPSNKLGEEMQKALGFDIESQKNLKEWLSDPEITGHGLEQAQEKLRQALSYLAWHDQRQDWRYTSPSLERVGLLRVEYEGLEKLAHDEAIFEQAHPLLKNASPEVRKNVFTALFDHLRRSLAVTISPPNPEERRNSEVRPPWNLENRAVASPRQLVFELPRKPLRTVDRVMVIGAGPRPFRSRGLGAGGLVERVHPTARHVPISNRHLRS
ncbi:MAG: DEAD/DEAH box helicase, partial [Sandaracinaceae bacterium]|nr:DEAD/DEAH box helicase [Sandaracinaceae bacterium]